MPRSGTRSPSSGPPDHVFFTDRNLGKKVPAILRGAGLKVESHLDHFTEKDGTDSTPDEEWLPFVGRRGWILLTLDKRMNYRARQKDQIMMSGLRAFLFTGQATGERHAQNFLRSLPRIARFLARHEGPFIAKLRLSSERDEAMGRPGSVEMWTSSEQWHGRRGATTKRRPR